MGMINLVPLGLNKLLQHWILLIRTAVDSGRTSFSYSIDCCNNHILCLYSAFHPEASQSLLWTFDPSLLLLKSMRVFPLTPGGAGSGLIYQCKSPCLCLLEHSIHLTLHNNITQQLRIKHQMKWHRYLKLQGQFGQDTMENAPPLTESCVVPLITRRAETCHPKDSISHSISAKQY